MKVGDRAVFKVQIELTEDGLRLSSFGNQKIPYDLFSKLHKAVHRVSDEVNGKLDWRKEYIKFTHEGVRYTQVDSDICCKGCCFYLCKNGISCHHPHYLDGTKGDCTGKIYKVDKEDKKCRK